MTVVGGSWIMGMVIRRLGKSPFEADGGFQFGRPLSEDGDNEVGGQSRGAFAGRRG